MRSSPSLGRLLALVGVCLSLVTCGRQELPLRVATHPWIGYEALCLAEDLGTLPEHVVLRHGSRAADTMAALRAGDVDAGMLTLDEVLQVRADGTPLTIVLIFDSSSGADVVLARPDIRQLTQLAGKRIGYEPSAVGALVLSELLAQAGLEPGAVALVELPLTEQLAAWQAGQVDAIISYEPTATRLLAQGAVRLFDSRQMPDTIFDVLAVRSDRIEGRQTALRKAIDTHFRMRAYINANRDDAAHRIAAHQGVASDDVRRALAGVTMPDVDGNRYALESAQPKSRFDDAVRRVHRLMTERGMLKGPDTLARLYTADFLPTRPVAPP